MNNQYDTQQSVQQQTAHTNGTQGTQNVLQQAMSQQTPVQHGMQQSPRQDIPIGENMQGISQQTVQQGIPQQSVARQSVPQQGVQQQSVPQQGTPQQSVPQQPYNPQYGQPYMQQPVYTKPPKPYIDPETAKKQKRDALNALGDKLTDLMNTNPVLKAIAAHADLYSFAATALCVLFTVIALLTSNEKVFGKTVNAGGEIGGCFVFSLLAVIFGGFSLCRKKILPLTVSMTSVTILMFVRFIVNIVTFAVYGSIIEVYGSVTAGNVINFIFMIAEMGSLGYLTYICWTYLLAALPPKSVMQQIYQQSYGVPQNNPQQPYQQPPMQTQQTQSDQQRAASPIPAAVTAGQSAPQSVPASSAQPIPQPAPAAQPVTVSPRSSADPVETAERKRACPNCGEANNSDSLFCHKCGRRLL